MIIARLRFLACACFTIALLTACPVLADESPVESFTLANGLEVIVLPNHRVPAVSQMIWYRVGAADDPRGESGLAHFHEHTMFLGTAKIKAHEYAALIASHGGEENAFTGHDATSYYISIAKDQLPLAMQLEADRMHDLTPSDGNMAKEKQVIIEERRMRIENDPQALLSEQIDAALFRNHPYHRPVIGWMSEMKTLSKDEVLAFHKTWYHPNNAILILSGDITAAEARPLVQKYYGGLKRVAVPQRVWPEEPPQNNARRIVMHHVNVKQPSWSRSYAASSFAYGDKEQALPLFVLSQLLGEGKTSRLYQSIVVDQKLATDIASDYNGFTLGPAEFTVSAVPAQGVDPAVLEAAIDKELAHALKDGFTDAEMARAKTLLKAESVYARDSLTEMARIMGWIRIVGLDKDFFTRWPQMIDAVSAQQVQDAAKATLSIDQSVTALLLPEPAVPASVPAPAAPSAPREARP